MKSDLDGITEMRNKLLSVDGYESRPILIDLFCCGGGCSVGYYRAGFKVVGIDIVPQPHYPFPFLQMDALQALEALIKGEGLTFSNGETLYLKDFAAIHASPPCQHYALISRVTGSQNNYPDLINATRQILLSTNKPFVIENVPAAKNKLIEPIMLCGSMFGLKVIRHRLFELNGFEILFAPYSCGCKNQYTMSGTRGAGISSFAGGASMITVTGHDFKVSDAKIAMGIDWMVGNELREAIPPAYTEFIGKHLLSSIERSNQ